MKANIKANFFVVVINGNKWRERKKWPASFCTCNFIFFLPFLAFSFNFFFSSSAFALEISSKNYGFLLKKKISFALWFRHT